MGRSPATLRAAAVVQAAEAALVLAATVLAGIDTAAGRSYQTGSGIALTVIGAASAAALAVVAVGLARARRWSRTPGPAHAVVRRHCGDLPAAGEPARLGGAVGRAGRRRVRCVALTAQPARPGRPGADAAGARPAHSSPAQPGQPKQTGQPAGSKQAQAAGQEQTSPVQAARPGQAAGQAAQVQAGGRARSLIVGGQALPELGEGPGQQPRHVHLGDAELGGDLRLGHVAEEPQQQDPLLARRQLLQQRLERLAVLDALERLVHRCPSDVGHRTARRRPRSRGASSETVE